MIVSKILLDTTGIIVISVFAVALVLLIAILFIYFYSSKKKKGIQKKKEEQVIEIHNDDKFIESLGGLDNIEFYELKGLSRLVIKLKDYAKFDKEQIKRFYVSRILEMSDKVILVGENLKPLLEILDKSKTD